jgi:phospholipid/cholesterol/gamma-HCH transport system substrate-binding protein
MNPKVNYVLVGLFVLLLGAALIGGVLWIGAGGPGKHYDRYVVYMTESVSGLSKDAAVTYHGVDVGRVRQISIDPENLSRVKLVLDIESGTPIKEDTAAILETQGLTGLAHIDLSGGSQTSPLLRAHDDEEYPVIKSRPSLLGRLDTSVSELIENLTETSQRLNTLLGNDNQHSVAQTLAHLESLSKALASRSDDIAAALSDFSGAMQNARKASTQLPALLEQVNDSAAALQKMADALAATGNTLQKTAESSGRDVQQFTTEVLPEASALVTDLRQAAANLRQMSEQLERDPSVLFYGAPQPRPGPGER